MVCLLAEAICTSVGGSEEVTSPAFQSQKHDSVTVNGGEPGKERLEKEKSNLRTGFTAWSRRVKSNRLPSLFRRQIIIQVLAINIHSPLPPFVS